MKASDVIEIVKAGTVDDELLEAMDRLVPQLSSSSIPTRDDLSEVVTSPSTTLLLARERSENRSIVGILTLALFRIPTGVRAWIEDVAVDQASRGKGIGELLSREALRVAEPRE